MVNVEAEIFENLRSVHCLENAVSEPFTIFSGPKIDKRQNVLGYTVVSSETSDKV